jgi:hypothetical protein
MRQTKRHQPRRIMIKHDSLNRDQFSAHVLAPVHQRRTVTLGNWNGALNPRPVSGLRSLFLSPAM